MDRLGNYNFRRWGVRLVLICLAAVPFFYWPAFYGHFYAYLTGTILNGVIQKQWLIVLASIIFFLLFLIPLSYRKRAKWLDYGLVGAFFVSLFIEMYGIPLTILLASKYFFQPGVNLPANVIEFKLLGVGIGMDLAMVYGAALIVAGLGLIAGGWYSLYRQAKKKAGFARRGLYAWSRHAQYLGFILVILGWFFGWPTILTLVFSPILVYKYVRAGQAEERDMLVQYGEAYRAYSQSVPFLL